MKQSDKEVAKKAFEAGIRIALSKEFPYDNTHFEKWFNEKVIPKEVEDAINYVSSCESDIGFMGSPEYYEAKKRIEKWNHLQ